jgi:hypothetical protein
MVRGGRWPQGRGGGLPVSGAPDVGSGRNGLTDLPRRGEFRSAIARHSRRSSPPRASPLREPASGTRVPLQWNTCSTPGDALIRRISLRTRPTAMISRGLDIRGEKWAPGPSRARRRARLRRRRPDGAMRGGAGEMTESSTQVLLAPARIAGTVAPPRRAEPTLPDGGADQQGLRQRSGRLRERPFADPRSVRPVTVRRSQAPRVGAGRQRDTALHPAEGLTAFRRAAAREGIAAAGVGGDARRTRDSLTRGVAAGAGPRGRRASTRRGRAARGAETRGGAR